MIRPIATPNTIGDVGNVATSTNPVAKVPKMAPAVPSADSRPTVRPVSARSASCSLITVGGTADNTAAGAKKPSSASNNTAAGPPPSGSAPTSRTIGTMPSDSAPPRIRIGPSITLGSIRSASRPPIQVPSEMAARIVPMIAV